jgi:hypothetical protein
MADERIKLQRMSRLVERSSPLHLIHGYVTRRPVCGLQTLSMSLSETIALVFDC